MTGKKRKAPTTKEKLASALLALDHCRAKIDPTLAACIDREKAKDMTPEQIIGTHDFDHFPIPHAWGGTNHPTNLVPRPREEHRAKTAKKDVPMIAKVKRVAAKSVIVRKSEEEVSVEPKKGKSKWQSAPLPGTKASGIKKSMSGKVSKR